MARGTRSFLDASRFSCTRGGCKGLLVAVALHSVACQRAPRETPPTAVATGETAPDPSVPPGETPSPEDSLGPQEPQAAEESTLSKPVFAERASPAFSSAFEELREWVKKSKGTLYAAVVDLDDDVWLVRHRAEDPINVASNAKVVTTAAALSLLGPAYQFKTEVFCDLNKEGVCPRLVIRGGGAPDLSTTDLSRFVSVLRGRGLKKVEALVVDQSLYDTPYEPPAYNQQPEEWAPFRANISALSIDQNAVTLNVAPAEEGQAAHVWYDPEGVVHPVGQIKTGESGSGDKVSWSMDPSADKQFPDSKVGGSLAVDSGRRRYARRLEDPRLAGGLVLRSLLSASGVQVPEKVTLGEREKEDRVALWYSEPLAELVRALGKDSDNFYAESVFAALSQAPLAADTEKTEYKWSSARGAAVASEWLSGFAPHMDGIVVKNGSGLFDANRYSAELLVTVLAHVEDNPRIYYDFVSQLAMGATDGTMKSRMKGSDVGERIRAKTGTLRNVDALSGYIGRTGGKSPLAFSLIVVDAKTSHGDIRNHVDQAVLSWAALAP